MPNLDPELELLLERRAALRTDSTAAFPAESDELIGISVQFDGDLTELETLGFRVTNSLPNVASGGITLTDLAGLAQHPAVRSIRKIRPKYLHLNDSIPDIKANQVWTQSGDNFTGFSGAGVIVGIIDTGIDFRHLNFRKPDSGNTTRILKIWDQTLTAQGSELPPPEIDQPTTGKAKLGYGVVYNKDAINAALQSSNPVPIRHLDIHGHGTHVAGIAAGNGLQGGRGGSPGEEGCHFAHRYIGVAPKADLIIVRMNGLTSQKGTYSGDPAQPSTPAGTPPESYDVTMDAITFILEEARQEEVRQHINKPVVINMSFGAFTELMDGTSDDAVAMNKALQLQPARRALVMAAGNEGASKFHAHDTIAPGTVMDLNFVVAPSDNKTRKIHIPNPNGTLDVQLFSTVPGPNGKIVWVTHGTTPTPNSPTANGPNGSVDVINRNNRIRVTINVPSAGTPPVTGTNMSGIWKIELRNNGPNPETFDAFCLRGNNDSKAIHFTTERSTANVATPPNPLAQITTRNTLSEDATAQEVITVGSYSVGSGNLARSSGRGNTLDGRVKPEITAPGVGIDSAAIPEARVGDDGCRACCCDCCQDFYINKGGTSMAAPHVAGAIALLFEANPDLTYTKALDYLKRTARPKPSDSTPDDDFGWGAGKLNIFSAMTVMRAEMPVPAGPVDPVPFVATPPLPPMPFGLLQERFLRTERGPEWRGLVEKYFGEVRRLINTNKRVATVWHRSGGPLWVRTAFRAAAFPQEPIPTEIAGFSLRASLDKMLIVLKRYGSEALVRDLTTHEPELDLLQSGVTLWQLIDFLGQPLEVVHS